MSLEADAAERSIAWSRRAFLERGLGLGVALGAALTQRPARGAEACAAQPATLPFRGRFYGCPVGADYFTNRFIASNSDLSIRFVAEESGSIRTFRWQCRHDGPPPVVHTPQTGHHSDGWGGNVTATLRRDRGDGTPDMASGGALAWTLPNNGSSTPLVLGPQETTWRFVNPAPVVCGRTYHLVFRNTHPTDRVSINANFNWIRLPENDPGGVNGPYYRSDWSLLVRHLCPTCPDTTYPAVWTDLRVLPWITFRYTSGVVTGCCQDWAPQSAMRPINASQWARQSFTVRNHTFVADTLWLRMWSTDGLGELVVRLVGGNGAAVFEVALPAASMPVGDRKVIAVPWTRIDLGQPVELRRDAAYNLVFRSSGGAFATTAIRDGAVLHGFESRNRWLSSQAQFTDNAGASWSGWVIPGQSSKARNDMMLPTGFGLVGA